MMINCDYCGATIDTSKYKVCPHCGASYADDQELINNKKREEEIKNINVERQRIDIENQKLNTEREKENAKFRKKSTKVSMAILYVLAIPGILLALCCICAIPTAIVENKDSQVENEIVTEEITPKPEIVETCKTGGFNEPLSTSTYTVTITELKKANNPWHWQPNKDYMYIALYFEVENINNESIYSDEQVYCSVNGIKADAFSYSEDKYLQKETIPKGMKIGGYLCYEVPISSKEFIIQYGEYLTFTIPNTLEQGE